MTLLMTSEPLLDTLLDRTGEDAAIAASHAEVLDDAFVQFFLCIHAFGKLRKVAGMQSTLDGQVLDDKLVVAGRAILIPSAWALPISGPTGRLRQLVRTHCLSGDGKSHYLINVERAAGFFETFNNLVAAHNEAADELAAHYDEVQAEIRENWRDKYPDALAYHQKVGRLLPATAAELRARYEVEYRLVVKSGETATLGASRLKAGPVREWFEIAHRRALEHVAEQRRARYREPIDRLRQGLVGLKAQIDQGDRISLDTFTAFEDTLVLFDICASIIVPELVTVVAGLRTTLTAVKAEALQAMNARTRGQSFTSTVKAKKASLGDMIDRVVRDCEAATTAQAIAAQIGRTPRAIQLSGV
jgi:hypothetical protein